MKIITISREFGSGGREIGKRISDILNMNYYDREILTAIAKNTEMDERYIESIINNGSIHSFPLTFGRTFSYSSDINNKAVLLAQQHKIIKEIAISFWLAIPIITLSGIQNGDDIGTIAAILFNSLVGFIIVK